LGPHENCGAQPPRPGAISSFFSSSEKQAETNYYACLERNKRRDYFVEKGKMQTIVYKVRESCQNAIRKISQNPSTLSFDSGQDFSFSNGLNGSGINTTDGGFSVNLQGSDIRGSFNVTCYMDKFYNITNVR
jgi:hypothetical protein